jgi:hypothetical protein
MECVGTTYSMPTAAVFNLPWRQPIWRMCKIWFEIWQCCFFKIMTTSNKW